MTLSRRGGVSMRLAVAVCLTLGVAGCGETSKVDPDAKVTISGEVRTPSGDPLAERPVRLATGASGGDVVLAVVTLGLVCSEGVCGDTVRSASTDADGTYRFVLEGRDTQTSFGNVRTQVVSADAPPEEDEVSGPSAAARFVVQTERVRIPLLQMVDPALSLEASSGEVVASWDAAPGAPYDLSFEADSTIPVWQVTTAETAATVDTRVLEDSSGRVVVSGETPDRIEGSDVTLSWRSPGLAYAADGVPMSRGASCTFGTAKPASPTGTNGDCAALTDGELFLSEQPVGRCGAQASPPRRPSRRCKKPTTATIEMTSAGPADLIVVRGCDSSCPLEISSDGLTFRHVAAASGPFAEYPYPRRPCARSGSEWGSTAFERSRSGGRPTTRRRASTLLPRGPWMRCEGRTS